MDQAPDLIDAVARLKAFLAGWNSGEVIDEDSGMTADDLGVMIAFVNDFPSSD